MHTKLSFANYEAKGAKAGCDHGIRLGTGHSLSRKKRKMTSLRATSSPTLTGARTYIGSHCFMHLCSIISECILYVERLARCAVSSLDCLLIDNDINIREQETREGRLSGKDGLDPLHLTLTVYNANTEAAQLQLGSSSLTHLQTSRPAGNIRQHFSPSLLSVCGATSR